MIDVFPFVKSLKNEPVAILGLGRSGLSAVRALGRAGAKIFAWDDNGETHDAARKAGAEIMSLNEDVLERCAVLVPAPGVPLEHPVVMAARKAGVDIIGDIEILHRCRHGRRTIGITGTNGKSTTAALIAHILNAGGKSAVLGGNIGTPVLDLDMPPEDGIFVLELSSYQLDLCPAFRPDIAVLLNITPDHLDRHGTMENYAAAKERIFEGPGTAIIAVDDDFTRAIRARAENRGERGVTAVTMNDNSLTSVLKENVLKGLHNVQNALAARAACRAAGMKDEQILKALQSFPGLPHRQFPVRRIGAVTYINDSKATNAEAAGKALAAFDNIYWILGGRPKTGGLDGLEPFMSRVRHAFLIGEAAGDFALWLKKQNTPYTVSGTLDRAVQDAGQMAESQKQESVVLLSPACASFDQFSSFEERGDQFTRLVRNLKDQAA